MTGDEGLRFFLFRKKERTKEKSILSFSRLGVFIRYLGYGFFIREAARMGGFDRLTRYESAAFTWDYFYGSLNSLS